MSSSASNAKIQQSVVAITRTDGWLRAVELRDNGRGCQVLWARSDDDERSDWRSFAVKCGLLTEPDEKRGLEGDRIVVAGFESSGVAFYRLDLTAVNEDEMASVVKLQAESRLPLPTDQMELAWRTGQGQNGQVPVTMAAARTERPKAHVEQVKCFSPGRILLDSEGVVEAWSRVFGGGDQTTVVMSVGPHATQVCLAQNRQLSNSVVLDVGAGDFRAATQGAQAEIAERFVQDTKSVLELFNLADHNNLPITLLSDGDERIENMVAALNAGGLNATAALPKNASLSLQGELRQEDIYDYRVPIGLGLMALDPNREAFDVFEQVYVPLEEGGQKHWIYSPKIALALAGAMILFLLLVCYAVDLATPGALERRLQQSLSDTDIQELIAKQKLIKTVAQARPDMLELIQLVNEKGASGIKLTGLHFKKGQTVSVTGEARNQDDLYKFHEALKDDKNVKRAVIQSATPDSKGSKVTFTVNFSYKNFSNKTSRISTLRL